MKEYFFLSAVTTVRLETNVNLRCNKEMSILSRFKKPFIIVAGIGLVWLTTAMTWSEIKSNLAKSKEQFLSSLLDTVTAHVQKNDFPETIKVSNDDDSQKYKVRYTLDANLQEHAEKLLKRYKPDYGAVFMFDVKTGKILAMASQQKGAPDAPNLNLRATFPAASIFKVVTAAAAIDHAGLTPERKIAFNGGNYTLYKRNVLSEQINKWTRFVTLKDAFARSLNTAFGRLALENLDPKSLAEYARKFHFNRRIETDFSIPQSVAEIPDDNAYELTQAASGFTRETTLSPVHGAMIASTVVNKGQMVTPFLVSEVRNEKDEVIYSAGPARTNQVIRAESADKLTRMMEQTVLAGTSRKAFRQILRDKKFKEVEMGGKTGHLTGMNPRGRTDWFVGYATDGDDSVAIATITVNKVKWTVKSSSLAEMMFREHFNTIRTQTQQQRDSDLTRARSSKRHMSSNF